MDLTVKKASLLPILERALAAAERGKTSMPILSHFLLRADSSGLTVCATDMETFSANTISCIPAAQGGAAVPAKKFHSICKSIRGADIYLKTIDSRLHIESGTAKLQLVALDPADFPAQPQRPKVEPISFDAEAWCEALDMIIPTISDEDTRFNLACLFLEPIENDDFQGLRMVSTDGHNLSYKDWPELGVKSLGLDKGLMIPKRTVLAMRRAKQAAEAKFYLSHDMTSLEIGRSALFMRPNAEGGFPEYRVVLPKGFKHHTLVPRERLAAALHLVAELASDRFAGASFRFGENRLTISAQNPELGNAEEALETESEGPAVEIGLNVKYVLSACRVMKSDVIKLSLVDEQHPIQITGEGDEGFLTITMPMRL